MQYVERRQARREHEGGARCVSCDLYREAHALHDMACSPHPHLVSKFEFAAASEKEVYLRVLSSPLGDLHSYSYVPRVG